MAKPALIIERPRVEYRTNPIGIDVERPRFSWIVTSDAPDQVQSAWQIRVSSEGAPGSADLWDSGKTTGNATNQIAYGGRLLASNQRAWWIVRAWNGDDVVSEWSEPQFWETGIIETLEWEPCKWVSLPNPQPDADIAETAELDGLLPAAYLRTTFTIDKPVVKARLYATARGTYDPHLNGRRVGDHVFAPGWTDYLRRVQYQTFDVTDTIVQGENVLGGVLAPGWYAGYIGWRKQARMYGEYPSLFMQLRVTFDDGSEARIATGPDWQGTTGPIRYGDFQMGEWYDARRAIPGWDTPGDHGIAWEAVSIAGYGHRPLVADTSEPVRALETFAPIARTEPVPGTFIFDIGQNIAGWATIRAKGEAGTTISARFAEILNPDGTIYTENLRDARCTDTFVLAGTGDVEEFDPRFTFHGFRYVELTGYPGTPEHDAVTAQFVGSDTVPASTFTCSDDLTNNLFANIVYGQRGNFLSVPTDCPQRDERLGWLGDAQVFVGTAAYNMDVAAFFTKWMVDVDDAQSEAGAYSNVAPRAVDQRDSAPAWADCGVIVPWTIWQRYGDTRIIEAHWPAMERWMAYLQKWNPDGLWKHRRGNDYGDWLSIGADTDKEVIGSAYYAYDARLMAEMAAATGRDADAARYRALFDRCRAAFNAAYQHDDGSIQGDTQTTYCLSLHFGLAPDHLREKIAARLVADIEAKGNHLSTGFVGVSYLCHVLTAIGRSDVAWGLVHQEEYPGWKYSILHGATTIWERWDGWTAEKGFQTPTMNSFNHYSLGSVGEWMFRTALGIDQAAESTGFETIRIRPQVDTSLDFAEGAYDSIRGRIATRWEREGDGYRLHVQIPANCVADVEFGDRVERVRSGFHEFTAEGWRN
jgi:alpha-L-rhamnosidase